MDREQVLERVRNALASIANPRFYDTERGFQGALVAELTRTLPDWSSEDAIVEQEYQKRLMAHGIKIRPDIIVHEPFDPGKHKTRSEGNVVVIELKLDASASDAIGDFNSLREILDALDYPLGVFVNIGSTCTHIESAPEGLKGRLVGFAVSLENGKPQVVEKRA